MSMIEDRLRAATHAAADTIPAHSAPPLRLPEPARRAARGASRSRGRRLTVRLVAPLAAAAAVIAVIAVAASLPSGNQPPRPPVSGPASGLIHGVPRYYMQISNVATLAGAAIVRDTLTGATVATARPPRSYGFTYITGAADDRTFVLLGLKGQASRSPAGAAELFQAHFDPADRAITVTQLHVRANLTYLQALALSPNGAELAVSLVEGAGRTNVAQIQVYSLTSGTVREWHDPGSVQAMAWAPHGQLALDWSPAHGAGGIAMLDTNTAGGSLTGASRVIVNYQQPGHYALHPGFAVSGDGTTLVIPVQRVPWRNRSAATEIRWYSLATGREIRAYSPPPAVANESWQVLWTSSSGQVTVLRRTASDNTDRSGYFGVLRGSKFAPIPAPIPAAEAGGFYSLPLAF
jgi:hypothetical protein